jgi:thiol-disulfide isomerase/thioredoxin
MAALFLAADAYALAANAPNNKQSLILFWRSDCAPCLRELEILPLIAKAHPDLRIDVLSLEAHADKTPPALPENMHWVSAPESPEKMLENFGDKQHSLPYSVFVSANHALCGSHSGILGTDTVDAWVKQC